MSEFDPAKPVQTRDGRKAIFLSEDKNKDFPFNFAIQLSDFKNAHTWECHDFTRAGKNDEGEDSSNLDLVNVPEDEQQEKPNGLKPRFVVLYAQVAALKKEIADQRAIIEHHDTLINQLMEFVPFIQNELLKAEALDAEEEEEVCA